MEQNELKTVFIGKNIEMCGESLAIYIVIDKVTLKTFTCRSLSLISRIINIKYNEMRVRDWKSEPKQIFGRFTVEKNYQFRNNNVKFLVDGE